MKCWPRSRSTNVSAFESTLSNDIGELVLHGPVRRTVYTICYFSHYSLYEWLTKCTSGTNTLRYCPMWWSCVNVKNECGRRWNIVYDCSKMICTSLPLVCFGSIIELDFESVRSQSWSKDIPIMEFDTRADFLKSSIPSSRQFWEFQILSSAIWIWTVSLFGLVPISPITQYFIHKCRRFSVLLVCLCSKSWNWARSFRVIRFISLVWWREMFQGIAAKDWVLLEHYREI